MPSHLIQEFLYWSVFSFVSLFTTVSASFHMETIVLYSLGNKFSNFYWDVAGTIPWLLESWRTLYLFTFLGNVSSNYFIFFLSLYFFISQGNWWNNSRVSWESSNVFTSRFATVLSQLTLLLSQSLLPLHVSHSLCPCGIV